MIAKEFSNSTDRTEESLATQQAADKRLFDKMRQAEDEKFHSRPQWYPMEDRLSQAIARTEARIEANRRILDEERHEGFLDDEWHARGMW